GLSGGPDSSNLRKKLLKYMDLPQLLSSKALLEIVNTMYSKDEYKEIITKIRSIG
ncbi:MAG: DUF4093 domain-containing protein, partial [Oscillospiraceae bacterium]|nr:DUF4093 domain-containing protein [Oscillospiraceae bacterium]